MSNNKALVTLAIGEEYQSFWKQYAKSSWESYAKKHGYDIVVIEDYIDDSERAQERTPHWQKCLILEHDEVQEYDDVVWLDSDIVINYEQAPCIVSANESNEIGAILRSEAYSRKEDRENALNRMTKYNSNPKLREEGPISDEDRYERAGLGRDVKDSINTGVLVLKQQHEEILRHVYDHYEENEYSSKENFPLSYHLLKNDEVNGIDPRFNRTLGHQIIENYPFLCLDGAKTSVKTIALIVNTVLFNSYFLHFLAGSSRSYIQLCVLEGDLFDRLGYVEQHFPDEKFVIGEHELELPV